MTKTKEINAVLEGLDFVCNDDKIYTDCASQIHYYNINKQYNTGYDTKTYTSPKSKTTILQIPSKPSESYNQKENSQKSILSSETFQQKNYYHKNYIYLILEEEPRIPVDN
ncbi:uncharacterized protein LOC126552802 [Aphis gossypii]|uniref:uncharacterized protein LOC126552802 n=1 Tax=Aphis gossypii TaxID=80765 RepID=UPI002158F4E9|nr:uncharacterized protein LOC126552802 [Aphis gossypii]